MKNSHLLKFSRRHFFSEENWRFLSDFGTICAVFSGKSPSTALPPAPPIHRTAHFLPCDPYLLEEYPALPCITFQKWGLLRASVCSCYLLRDAVWAIFPPDLRLTRKPQQTQVQHFQTPSLEPDRWDSSKTTHMCIITITLPIFQALEGYQNHGHYGVHNHQF